MGPAAWITDGAYGIAGVLAAPVWLTRMAMRGKLRTDWPGRFGRARVPAASGPRVLLHAVSVGEVNAIRLLVEALAGRGVDVVIATTTDTGFARAAALFADRHAVVRYPFDFSFAVGRFLRAVRPDAVGLIELEVWPNFTRACVERGIPVCVVNGRLSERSARRYARVRALVTPSFRRLAHAAVQDDAYAARFARLGVPAERIEVTGTMKWDTAEIADDVEGADELRRSFGIDPARPLVVAGSTAPDEHALLHAAVPAGVQLLCAPRRPEWFDAAAAALPGCARRSRGDCGSDTGRFLLDTIGDLRRAYALADVVVIGRSFGTLHGSDMMEPVALGKPTVVGPAVTDFATTVDALLAGRGLVQTTADALPRALADLLADSGAAHAMAERGRGVIRAHQGATARHADLLVRRARERYEGAAEDASPRSTGGD